MPKTSASQFEMLVDFMERGGDLSKPSSTDGPNGRIINLRRWEELTKLLNSDATGDTKNTDKWRKVWSDLKNNTKRKKAKINQSASGTGGGPASKIKLTDLEDRVLNIIGPQAATGMPEVPEIGLNQELMAAGPSQCLPPSPPTPQETTEAFPEVLHQVVISGMYEPSSSICEPASGLIELASSPHELADSINGPTDSLYEPTCNLREPAGSSHEAVASPHTPTSRRRITPRGRLTARRHRLSSGNTTSSVQRGGACPEPDRERRRLTPRRRHLSPQHPTSPQRRRARFQTQADRTRQDFLESDREWRTFFMNREQESHRLREMELAQQARWQELFESFLVTCNAAIEAFKNKNT